MEHDQAGGRRSGGRTLADAGGTESGKSFRWKQLDVEANEAPDDRKAMTADAKQLKKVRAAQHDRACAAGSKWQELEKDALAERGADVPGKLGSNVILVNWSWRRTSDCFDEEKKDVPHATLTQLRKERSIKVAEAFSMSRASEVSRQEGCGDGLANDL